VRRSGDGGFIVLGRVSLFSDRSFLLRVDSEGRLLWRAFLPENRTGFALVLTGDEAYVVVGDTYPDSDVFLTKLRQAEFARGDVNGDGRINVTDPVRILRALFSGNSDAACRDSVDVDDNGALEVTDGIALLSYLFRGAATPPDPGPSACGADPTEDALDCEVHVDCM